MSDQPEGTAPTPTEDELPPEGPGGVDAVPDWEAADPNPLTPDQPQSAQVTDDQVPDEIQQGEDLDESDGAGSHPEGDEPEGDPGDASIDTQSRQKPREAPPQP